MNVHLLLPKMGRNRGTEVIEKEEGKVPVEGRMLKPEEKVRVSGAG
jgi:hypothetical protein